MDEFVRRPRRPKIVINSNRSQQAKTTSAQAKPNTTMTPNEPSPQPKQNEPTNEPSEQLSSPTPPKKPKLNFKLPTPKTKKQWIIAGIIITLLLSGAGFAIYTFILKKPEPVPVAHIEPEPEPEPAPEPIYSRLSGREITDPAINQRPLYAVQIENSPEARPQSGLRDADIVFEAIAEGGITRFNAIFQDNQPANIGPIRSLRPYYIDWFLPFDAAIVHAGGSGEALSDVRTLGLKDIDHGGDGGIFRRVNNRYAPHNLYSTGPQLLDLISKRGYTSTFTGFDRKPAEPATAPTATNITLDVSSALYKVNFSYDAATNTYLRSQGGGQHVDAETKQQIAPSVVVVPIMDRSTHPDRVHTKYGTTGSGKVYVFQDGAVTEGTWTKNVRSAQWQLVDTSRNPIKLNPGQTWFTMVESSGRVNFQP